MRRTIALVALVALAAALGTAVAVGQSAGSSNVLFAELRGTNERPQPGTSGRAGDRNALGSASVTIDAPRLCFGLAIRGTDKPVAAHIHRGGRNQNGPVVVPLGQGDTGEVPASGDPGAASACVTASAAVLRAIRRSPARYYVNVHTNDHPAGALRGQLFRAPRR
jgi:CHRD domain